MATRSTTLEVLQHVLDAVSGWRGARTRRPAAELRRVHGRWRRSTSASGDRDDAAAQLVADEVAAWHMEHASDLVGVGDRRDDAQRSTPSSTDGDVDGKHLEALAEKYVEYQPIERQCTRFARAGASKRFEAATREDGPRAWHLRAAAE